MVKALILANTVAAMPKDMMNVMEKSARRVEPKSTEAIIERCGHNTMVEQPEKGNAQGSLRKLFAVAPEAVNQKLEN